MGCSIAWRLRDVCAIWVFRALRWQTSERGSGHGTDTFKLAGYLMNTIGLSEEATLQTIASHYNGRCPTPYNERELARKVSEAATKMRAR